MSDWDDSAAAWIAGLGGRGDWSREWVVDPAMLPHIQDRGFGEALDVGCGEGRFCRLMRQAGIKAVGIDPTAALIEEARRRDPSGRYEIGRAEELPFASGRFDLVVSYLSLIDIPDFRAAIAEMNRVLKPGGVVLIANLASFVTAGSGTGWVKDAEGRRSYFPVDRYLDEYSQPVSWAGISIINWHRPLSAYMTALLDAGLILRTFEEPSAVGGDPDRAAFQRRIPWFVVMEWRKPT
jgi:SAM-dependent methyltransferase